MLRVFLKFLARMKGYQAIRKSRHPSLESHLEILFQHYRIDLVIDVGANTGQFGQSLRDFGYRNDIVSFEPNPEAYRDLLVKSGKEDRWAAYNLALGAEDGERDLIFAKNSLLSSFHPPSSFSKNSFGEQTDIVRTSPVTVATLDSFLMEQSISLEGRRVMLKLDTQGHDMEVCKGAVRSLPAIALLQSELSFKALYDGIPTYMEALRAYTAYGFEPTGLYPVGRDPNTMGIIEADCVFARPRTG